MKGEELRGGVALLVKHSLWEYIHDVRIEHDQIWFKLLCCPELQFGTVYIPPADSPYFTPASFAKIQEMILYHANKSVIFGDFNARICNLNVFDDPTRGIRYGNNVDGGMNNNGKQLADLCLKCELKPINHLKFKHSSFDGSYTYKQGSTWKSQIDWAPCYHNMLASRD